MASRLGVDLNSLTYLDAFSNVSSIPYEWIDTIPQLEAMVKDFEEKKVDIIGVDLEFAGKVNVFVTALMQISTIDKDYVIDALVLRDRMGPVLAPIFGNPNILKLLHGCDIDLSLLVSDLQTPIVNIYDTSRAFKEIMKRDKTNKAPNLTSFEYLARIFLNQQPDKRYQVAEWKLRPLPNAMLHYSRTDSHYLLYIYAILEGLMDPQANVKLMPETIEEHSEWIKARATDPRSWTSVK